MSEMVVTEVSMQEKCLADMPYEIAFEIFRRLPKGTLLEIYRLPSILSNVARDTRLWKDVRIEYWPANKPGGEIYAFEDLYSELLPVEVIDMSNIKIKPPVLSEIEQKVNVKKLFLSIISANKLTFGALLTKYQCTELYLDYERDEFGDWPEGQDMKIAPETFSKLTHLEVLSLRNFKPPKGTRFRYHQWLAQVLNVYCKNLKTLEFSNSHLSYFDLVLDKNLPTSLQKLCLIDCTYVGDYFFALLAERVPNLKELGLSPEEIECPSLLNFKSLETLHFIPDYDIWDLYKCLVQFPALKNVHCIDIHDGSLYLQTNVETLQTMLKPHGIAVKLSEDPAYVRFEDDNLWKVKSIN